MVVADFSVDERAFLCSPHAEESLRRAGVRLEELRPHRSGGGDDALGYEEQIHADAREKRRLYLWRLVREEHSRLERNASRSAPTSSTAMSGSTQSRATVAANVHEATLKRMVELETRALERDLRAEAQRERFERKQEAARAARADATSERERQRTASQGARDMLRSMHAARREMECDAAAAYSARIAATRSSRPSSAPPSLQVHGAARTGTGGLLADAVRARGEAVQHQRCHDIEGKMARKDAVVAKRREEIAHGRTIRRLESEQKRLRHEELQVLESAATARREHEERQEKADRDRAARRAAVGKVSAGAEPRGSSSVAAAEHASKVAERAAAAESRLEEQRRQQALKEQLRDEKAASARRIAREHDETRRREVLLRQHEQALRRAARMAAQQVTQEAERVRLENHNELVARRSEDVRRRAVDDRHQKQLHSELKAETHRQNAERLRRANEYRTALTEANIQAKNERYAKRKDEQLETQRLREDYQIARYRHLATTQSKLRAEAEARMRAGGGDGPSLPQEEGVSDSMPPKRATGSTLEPPRAAHGAAPSVCRHGDQVESCGGTVVASAGQSLQQRAAFAEIEKLRYLQNAELRRAVEAEQQAETERLQLLAATPEGADRARLQKLLKLERERADADLMGLTAEHELALANKFKKLGTTR